MWKEINSVTPETESKQITLVLLIYLQILNNSYFFRAIIQEMCDPVFPDLINFLQSLEKLEFQSWFLQNIDEIFEYLEAYIKTLTLLLTEYLQKLFVILSHLWIIFSIIHRIFQKIPFNNTKIIKNIRLVQYYNGIFFTLFNSRGLIVSHFKYNRASLLTLGIKTQTNYKKRCVKLIVLSIKA